MSKDWLKWHSYYDKPDSSLINRLDVVQRDLRRALQEAPPDCDGVLRLISMCAGEGRDVLPVLGERHTRRVSAFLIELDPVLSQRARSAAADLGLSGVQVRTADAGATDTYHDLPLAHVLMVCSVFGNISPADMRQTIATLPTLLEPGAIVIWTRSGRTGHDPSLEVRSCFLSNDFTEISFTPTVDDTFRIGMHRFDKRPADAHIAQPGTRMFAFA